MNREWSEKASADDDAATATHAAATGKQYTLRNIQASFSGAPSAGVLLQIKDGATVIWEGYVSTAEGIDMEVRLPGTPGNLMSAVLAASGAGGKVGKVNIQGTEF